MKIYNRGRTKAGTATGVTRYCRMEGCTGRRIGVRWPDGKITWPCSKGIKWSPKGKVGEIA